MDGPRLGYRIAPGRLRNYARCACFTPSGQSVIRAIAAVLAGGATWTVTEAGSMILTPRRGRLVRGRCLSFIGPSACNGGTGPDDYGSLCSSMRGPRLETVMRGITTAAPCDRRASAGRTRSPPGPRGHVDNGRHGTALRRCRRAFLRIPEVSSHGPIFIDSSMQSHLSHIIHVLKKEHVDMSNVVRGVIHRRLDLCRRSFRT